MSRRLLQRGTALTLAICVSAGLGGPALGDDAKSRTDAVDTPHQVVDACRFFRGNAFGKGLTHYATEMLWACEEIDRRRRSGMGLTERLARVETRLDAYRRAVVAANVEDFTRARAERRPLFGIGEEETLALAESTGALAVLDEIRHGF